MGISLRLAEVLQLRMGREGRSYLGLSEDIRSAYERVSGRKERVPPIDRRKLKRIIERDPDLSLSMRELQALDAYLAQTNDGLAERPLFRREGILHVLAHREVTFFVGARSQHQPYPRQYLSVWDVHAYSALHDSITAMRSTARSALKTVAQTDPTAESLNAQLNSIGRSAAICSIGAPRSCPMSEFMLASMFGIQHQAFQLPSPGRGAIPFHFVWPPEHQVRSCFALDCDQLTDSALREEVRQADAWAFLSSSAGLKAIRWKERTYCDYGIIVAQRRRSNDQLWLVLAGLSGPGTHAAAQSLLENLESRTPRVPEEPETLYAIVEASVITENGAGTPGDRRQIQDHSLILGPIYWHPEPMPDM